MSAPTPPAFVLQIRLTIDPANSDAFLGHLRTIAGHVKAEPELAFFFISKSINEPGVYRLTEGWTKDVNWFNSEQFTKPYYKAFQAATEPLFTSPRVVETYTPVEDFTFIKGVVG